MAKPVIKYSTLALVALLLLGLLLATTAEDTLDICKLLEAGPNAAEDLMAASSSDRHMLLVHVSDLNQLIAFSGAAKDAVEAGVPLDCRYREIGASVPDPLTPLLTRLPVGHLKLAGQTEIWPLLLADGEVTGEALLARLTEQPAIVQDLDDASFEGLTQAATGSTTGHWLVAFLSPSDPQLAGKTRVLRGLAQLVRPARVSVARVLLGDASHATMARFSAAPESILLLRSGGFYRVPHPVKDWRLIMAFVSHGYTNQRRHQVPQPATPFDQAVEAALAFLLSFNSVGGVSPVHIAMCSAGFICLACLACVCLCAKRGLEKVVKTE